MQFQIDHLSDFVHTEFAQHGNGFDVNLFTLDGDRVPLARNLSADKAEELRSTLVDVLLTWKETA